jgi:hypothetical protein
MNKTKYTDDAIYKIGFDLIEILQYQFEIKLSWDSLDWLKRGESTHERRQQLNKYLVSEILPTFQGCRDSNAVWFEEKKIHIEIYSINYFINLFTCASKQGRIYTWVWYFEWFPRWRPNKVCIFNDRVYQWFIGATIIYMMSLKCQYWRCHNVLI